MKNVLSYIGLLLLIIFGLALSFIFGNVSLYMTFFSEPWMLFTIFDFYVLISLFIVWLFVLEKSWSVRILFSLLFIAGGAFGVVAFILYRLFKGKKLLK